MIVIPMTKGEWKCAEIQSQLRTESAAAMNHALYAHDPGDRGVLGIACEMAYFKVQGRYPTLVFNHTSNMRGQPDDIQNGYTIDVKGTGKAGNDLCNKITQRYTDVFAMFERTADDPYTLAYAGWVWGWYALDPDRVYVPETYQRHQKYGNNAPFFRTLRADLSPGPIWEMLHILMHADDNPQLAENRAAWRKKYDEWVANTEIGRMAKDAQRPIDNTNPPG